MADIFMEYNNSEITINSNILKKRIPELYDILFNNAYEAFRRGNRGFDISYNRFQVENAIKINYGKRIKISVDVNGKRYMSMPLEQNILIKQFALKDVCHSEEYSLTQFKPFLNSLRKMLDENRDSIIIHKKL